MSVLRKTQTLLLVIILINLQNEIKYHIDLKLVFRSQFAFLN